MHIYNHYVYYLYKVGVDTCLTASEVLHFTLVYWVRPTPCVLPNDLVGKVQYFRLQKSRLILSKTHLIYAYSKINVDRETSRKFEKHFVGLRPRISYSRKEMIL